MADVLSQIVASLMSGNFAPRVTPMGAAPGGGGGSVSVPARGRGGGSISYAQDENTPLDFPEIEIMQPVALNEKSQQYPQGTQIPFRPGSAPGQPNGRPLPTQGGQPPQGGQNPIPQKPPQVAPDLSPLRRGLTEAEERYERFANPKTLKDRWDARKELPKAKENYNQKVENIASFNDQQAFNAKQNTQQSVQELADNAYFTTLKATGDKELSIQVGTLVQNDPKNAAQYVGKAIDSIETQRAESAVVAETKRVEGRTDAQDEWDQAALAEFYMNEYVGNDGNPMDTKFASGLARNTVEPEVGIKLWEDHKTAQKENAAAIHLENVKFRDEMYKADQAINTVQTALGDVSPWTTGFGSVFAYLPGTPAKNLESAIDTLNAVQGFKELFDMRQASATGGALGNVSEREIELLYQAWTSLQTKLTPERLRKNLNKVLERFQRIKFLAQQSSEGTLFGMSPNAQEELATQHISELKHEGFVVDNPTTYREIMDGVRNGDISTKEFKDAFHFEPIPDNLPYEEE